MAQDAQRVAIVTGSARGIGAATAKRLAADGAAVVFSYLQNEAAAREVVREVTGEGGRAFAVRADQADGPVELCPPTQGERFTQNPGELLGVRPDRRARPVRVSRRRSAGENGRRLACAFAFGRNCFLRKSSSSKPDALVSARARGCT